MGEQDTSGGGREKREREREANGAHKQPAWTRGLRMESTASTGYYFYSWPYLLPLVDVAIYLSQVTEWVNEEKKRAPRNGRAHR